MFSMMKQPFRQSLSRPIGLKIIALGVWLLLLVSYYAVLRLNNWTVSDGVYYVSNWLVENYWGPVFFISLYVVGPLLFFPAIILSLLGGFVFGPMGILYTIIGSNASAMVAYSIGRFFGNGIFKEGDTGVVQRYAQRIRQNSFQTVLIMHLIFMPYGLVNYSGGFLQIGWKPFLAGTALGSGMATISIVMLGVSFGSVEELLAGKVRIDPVTLATSLLFIVSSIALSRYLRKRETQHAPSG